MPAACRGSESATRVGRGCSRAARCPTGRGRWEQVSLESVCACPDPAAGERLRPMQCYPPLTQRGLNSAEVSLRIVSPSSTDGWPARRPLGPGQGRRARRPRRRPRAERRARPERPQADAPRREPLGPVVPGTQACRIPIAARGLSTWSGAFRVVLAWIRGDGKRVTRSAYRARPRWLRRGNRVGGTVGSAPNLSRSAEEKTTGR